MPPTKNRPELPNARASTAVVALLGAALCLPMHDAEAANAWAGPMIRFASIDLAYKADVYEWAETRAYDPIATLPYWCTNKGTAPVVIWFHGGNGVDKGDYVKNNNLPMLARRLSSACVRIVAVQAIEGYSASDKAPAYSAGHPVEGTAKNLPYYAGNHMAELLTKIIYHPRYQAASNYIIASGSMGAVYSAAMLRQGYTSILNGSTAGAQWQKVDRFVLDGPPAGNVYNVCKNSNNYTGPLAGQYDPAKPYHRGLSVDTYGTGIPWDCRTISGDSVSYANSDIIEPFPADAWSKLQSANFMLHMIVGANDGIFGYSPTNTTCRTKAAPQRCATGEEGVRDFISRAQLPVGGPWSLTVLPGAGHGEGWTKYPTYACQLMSQGLVMPWGANAGTRPDYCYYEFFGN